MYESEYNFCCFPLSHIILCDNGKQQKIHGCIIIICRLVGCDIEAFKQEHCSEVKVYPDEITYKITFKQYGDKLDGRKFNVVCYIEEELAYLLFSVHTIVMDTQLR